MKTFFLYVIAMGFYYHYLNLKIEKTTNRFRVFEGDQLQILYESVSNEVNSLIKEKNNAVIVLPTGSTPIKLYKKLIKTFKENQNIDYSKAIFFNLDEYIGLEVGHPLSYHYYMEYYFYGPLKKIDSNRSPKNYFIPSIKNNESEYDSVKRYEDLINSNKLIDLVILGVGGAYPSDGIIKGGHLAFNEPGTHVNTRTHIVNLTEKTKKDTLFRFNSLKDLIKSGEIKNNFETKVPDRAFSLGLGNILESKK